MKSFWILSLVFLGACGYHFEGGGEKIAISVPYVKGDHEGELTDALARAISRTANFRYTQGEGDWTLKAKIVGSNSTRIGYRYDRNSENKELDNILGTESRKEITVEVSVVNSTTGKLIAGPQRVKSSADYDYVIPNVLDEVSFVNPVLGSRVRVIDFSLGQLDSVGAAGEDAIYPIYRSLAQKIIDGLIAIGGWDAE